MTRLRTESGPGGISVEEQDVDGYADFVALQDDEEERPRQPAPDLSKPSADELALMDAAREGQRAGEMSFGGSMNPFVDNCPEYAAWESARLSAVAYRLSVSIAMARCVC